MQSATDQNKAIVQRFNREIIEQGNFDSFYSLVSENCINHTAPPGTDNGPAGMIHFLRDMLRTGFSNITVTIHDLIAEGDKVCSRKTITGTHSGHFMGIAPTGKNVQIEVTDIIMLQDGKYIGHWGMSNIPTVVAGLASAS